MREAERLANDLLLCWHSNQIDEAHAELRNWRLDVMSSTRLT